MERVLPSWFNNLGKRLVKLPKAYFRDSGVLHQLLGISSMQELRMYPRYGASLEGFALEQTMIAHAQRDAYFHGTQRGAELDLLGSYVVDGVLMGYNPLISNEEQIFKRCAHF